TANARAMGSRQAGDFSSHVHTLPGGTWDTFSGSSAMSSGGTSGTVIGRGTTAAGGKETRPMNVAFHPRIHA
ncbi:phage tail protein, partial [Achromobacter xylosoxidans]